MYVSKRCCVRLFMSLIYHSVNQIVRKLILNTKKQISLNLKILFLLVVFIALIKKESEANKCVDYSEYVPESCSEFVVDVNENPDLFLIRYYSADPFKNAPLKQIDYRPDHSPFYLSIHYIFNKSYNLTPIFLPQTKILKVLQKKNICHQSSDDTTAPVILC